MAGKEPEVEQYNVLNQGGPPLRQHGGPKKTTCRQSCSDHQAMHIKIRSYIFINYHKVLFPYVSYISSKVSVIIHKLFKHFLKPTYSNHLEGHYYWWLV